MALRHVGVRPLHPLTLVDFKKKIWEEVDSYGYVRRWNLRLLNSGCGRVFDGYQLEIYDCIYCPYCDEYFSKEQWRDEGEDISGDSERGGELLDQERSSELSKSDYSEI